MTLFDKLILIISWMFAVAITFTCTVMLVVDIFKPGSLNVNLTVMVAITSGLVAYAIYYEFARLQAFDKEEEDEEEINF
jgi:hypothetical protein